MKKTVSAQPAVSGRGERRALRKILVAAAVTGTLDILFITAVWWSMGVTPLAILQVIASGLLGGAALSGGLATAILGAALHYGMTTVMAAVYILYAPDRLRRQPWIAGPLYGAGIWLVMNLVVVPLSAAPVGMPPLPIALADFAAHLVLVGLPIALLALDRDGATRGEKAEESGR